MHQGSSDSAHRLALSATVHCVTGCSIGEILGMVIGTAAGWSNWATVVVAVILAFFFGYLLTVIPLRRAGIPWSRTLRMASAADTASITTMEIIDNAIMLVIPGAMEAGLGDALFWGSLLLALAVAGLAVYPVNRYLISRGAGHAVIHAHHRHSG